MKALITGITGQDGSYLAEFLLEKKYEVIGIVRRTSTNNTQRIEHIKDKIKLVGGDITDSASMSGIIADEKPDEVYNLAAQSHVGTSFKQPYYTFHTCFNGVLNLLEAIRVHSPKTKFYQASTSEMFGDNYSESYEGGLHAKYQDEKTSFNPQSPYACAKLAAHHLVDTYRNGYGIYACCGILFNHESERRGEEFVTRKITKWIGEFVKWKNSHGYVHLYNKNIGILHTMSGDNGKIKPFPMLRLGNIDAYRDWGHAEDYVRGMYLMLQQNSPKDYVLATGETHTIREFLTLAFKQIDIDNWEDYIIIDPQFYRPSEVEYLCGSAAKARSTFNWTPTITFNNLVERMVQYDMKESKWQLQLQEH